MRPEGQSEDSLGGENDPQNEARHLASCGRDRGAPLHVSGRNPGSLGRGCAKRMVEELPGQKQVVQPCFVTCPGSDVRKERGENKPARLDSFPQSSHKAMPL